MGLKNFSFKEFYNAPPKSGNRVARKQIIFLGLSNFCIYFCQYFIRSFLLQYYTIGIGFPLEFYVLISWIFLIWNLINDPMIGFISDRRIPDPEKGKRLVGMKRSLPLSAIGFLMVILVFPGWPVGWIFIQYLIGICIFDYANALWNINIVAYRLTIPANDDERGKIGMWTGYFITVPGALAMVIPMLGLTSNENLIIMQVIMVIVCVCLYFLSYFTMRKLEEPIELYSGELYARDLGLVRGEIQENDSSVFTEIKTFFKTLKSDMIDTFRSKPFRKYLIFSFLSSSVAYGVMGNLIFLLKYVYLGGGGNIILLLTIVSYGADALVQPIILWIRKKIGTVNTFYLCLLIGFIGFFFILFTRSPEALIPLYILIAIGNQSILLLIPLCSRDVTEEDYVKTGIEKQGKFTSVSMFLKTLNTTILISLISTILLLFGYDPALELDTVSEFTQLGFLTVGSIIPILFIILSIVALKFYPLKGEYLKEIKTKVIEMDKKALDTLTQSTSLIQDE